MFDVSFVELLIVGIIALLVVGPERLPGLARTVGLWVGKARSMVMDVKKDIDKELREDELRRKLGLDSLGDDAKALEDLKKLLEDSVEKDERSDYLVKAIDAQKDTLAQKEADARREVEAREARKKLREETPAEHEADAEGAAQAAPAPDVNDNSQGPRTSSDGATGGERNDGRSQ